MFFGNKKKFFKVFNILVLVVNFMDYMCRFKSNIIEFGFYFVRLIFFIKIF